ncbi:O-antigen ligase family protein [Marivivens sp. LCG002]|uniref:O-antigen ligase family protein n=1 Tax=Marivivens sp. LCG002 TaxID=3051171 RepID=UPI002552BDAB|nr:O-antigen ligase family protein [Marivivens sp. LCG002]WIV50255.1 O-antigen ligase family protein [Marivivens sp. LCG002]
MIRLAAPTRFVSILFILALPFCAWRKPGFLGNFDTNLGLYALPLLVPMILWQGGARMFLLRGQGGDVLRVVAVFLLCCTGLTLWNGAQFSALGLSAYGLEPLAKSLRTAVVPIVLLALVLIGMSLPFFIGRNAIQSAIIAAFLLTCLYSVIQFGGLVGRGGLHSLLWPIVEGARDNYGSPAIARFGRLTGPTMEPAELAKLVMLLFVPWFIYPAAGLPSLRLLSVGFGLVLATASLIGVLLTVVVGLYLWRGGRPSNRWRIMVIGLLGGAAMLALRDIIAPVVFERISTLSQDPSALIRATYNKAALSIIIDHPFVGVGWSNEVFFFPQRVSNLAHLWEVSEDLRTGNALTAKSLILRLGMYGGVLGTGCMVTLIAWVLRKGGSADQRRARLCFGLLLVAGLVDGGILTSFYLWVGPSLTLGMLAYARYVEGNLSC